MGRITDGKGKFQTIEEIRQSIKELEAEHQAFKKKRVAAGLPEESPKSFVEPEHAEAMVDQLRPLYEVLTTYLAITNKAQQIIPFDVADFAPFEKRITLVFESKESDHLFYAEVIRRAIKIIGEAQRGEVTFEYVVNKLYRYLTMASECIELNRRPRRIKPYRGDDLPQIIEDYWTYYIENVEEDRRLSRELSKGTLDTAKTTSG